MALNDRDYCNAHFAVNYNKNFTMKEVLSLVGKKSFLWAINFHKEFKYAKLYVVSFY
jgi:hypothetical protein